MASAQIPGRHEVIYPDSDRKPIADNILQFRWIVTIQGGLDALFKDNPDVFVAGDLLWYPVEGDNRTRAAPDAMVVFGRPKGDCGSYRQWEEAGIAIQVVFEVLSPKIRPRELAPKFTFYEQFGVEEYYIYDPDHVLLEGWLRDVDRLEAIPDMDGWISPRLGIRFDLKGDELRIVAPDGRGRLLRRTRPPVRGSREAMRRNPPRDREVEGPDQGVERKAGIGSTMAADRLLADSPGCQPRDGQGP